MSEDLTQRKENAHEAPPECPLSQRVDGKLHTWRWDGDDPRVVCYWCGQMQDALTGRVIKPGRRV